MSKKLEKSDGEKPFDGENGPYSKTVLDSPEVLSRKIWAELRVFLAVAKGKSYNRGAEIVGLNARTVKRQISRLQDVFGVELFVSTPGGVTLTRAGEVLARQIANVDYQFHKITEELASVAEQDRHSVVRVGTTEALGAFFVSPLIADFQEAFPSINIDLRTIQNANDIRENHIDVMLSTAPMPGNDIVEEEAGCVHFIPYAATNYINRYGAVTEKNVENHVFVDASMYQSPFWRPWNERVSRADRRHFSENSISYGTMIVSGVGIGLLGSFMALHPNLRRVDLDLHFSARLYVASLGGRLADRAVKQVYRWMLDVFSSNNPWFADELSCEPYETDYDKGIRRVFGRYVS